MVTPIYLVVVVTSLIGVLFIVSVYIYDRVLCLWVIFIAIFTFVWHIPCSGPLRQIAKYLGLAVDCQNQRLSA